MYKRHSLMFVCLEEGYRPRLKYCFVAKFAVFNYEVNVIERLYHHKKQGWCRLLQFLSSNVVSVIRNRCVLKLMQYTCTRTFRNAWKKRSIHSKHDQESSVIKVAQFDNLTNVMKKVLISWAKSYIGLPSTRKLNVNLTLWIVSFCKLWHVNF